MQLDLFNTSDGHILIEIEEWLPVPDFPAYEASNLGRFRRKKDCLILNGTIAFNGYVHIGLTRNGKQVTKLAHRLIAAAWLVQPSPKHSDVNHKNKVRADNRVSNLEWSTRSHNSKHARKHS